MDRLPLSELKDYHLVIAPASIEFFIEFFIESLYLNPSITEMTNITVFRCFMGTGNTDLSSE